MSLVFSGVSPHPPLVMEGIGKEKSKELKKTKSGLKQLEKDLYITKPDTILVISTQAGILDDAFSINISHKLRSDFTEFGDLSTQQSWNNNCILADNIYRKAKDIAQLTNKKKLDYGSSIPMHFLTEHMKNIQVLPVGCCSSFDDEKHIKMGKKINDVIRSTTDRVAVIASGNTSNRVSQQSPAGFHKDGVIFDKRLKKFLKNKNLESIKKMDQDIIKNARQFIYKPLLVLLGILGSTNYEFRQHSYQQAFGVGHLTANFHLP